MKKSCRGNVIQYITKEDDDPCAKGIDVDIYKMSKKNKRGYVANLILSGKKL